MALHSEGRNPKPPTVPYDSYEEAPPQPKESPDPEPAGLEAFVESEQMKNAALEGLGQLTRLSIIADGYGHHTSVFAPTPSWRSYVEF